MTSRPALVLPALPALAAVAAVAVTLLPATPAGAAAGAVPVLGTGRALSAALPAPDGGPGGSARVTSDPVNGRTCVSTSGLPGGATLALSATVTGARTALGRAAAPGCVSLPPGVAGDLLAHPDTYSLVLTPAAAPDGGPGGPEVSGTLAAAAPATRPYAVGTRTATLVDRTRGTARRGAVGPAPARALAVTYYYPAQGPAGAVTRDAEADLEGPFPVVLFAHGFASTPAGYARTLRAWAEAGYVVAAPLFPGSGAGLPGRPTEADITAQPRDLRVVLDSLEQVAVDPGSWLGGIADTHRVAVAGHSDGGSTAAAAGLLQGYTDPRYDAVIVMAGARFSGAPARRALPLLLLSGERDEYNAPSTFARVFNTGRGPRTWVQALRGSHGGPFTVGGAQAEALRGLEIAFLDRWLLGADTRGVEARLGTVPGLTKVRAGGF